jgi:hypothetical protein
MNTADYRKFNKIQGNVTITPLKMDPAILSLLLAVLKSNLSAPFKQKILEAYLLPKNINEGLLIEKLVK